MSEPKIIREYTPEETSELREQYLQEKVHPVIKKLMETFPKINMVLFQVAQYWCDEAEDAVHCALVASDKFELSQAEIAESWQDGHFIEEETNEDFGIACLLNYLPQENIPKAIELYQTIQIPDWDENEDMIPLFAAYTNEGYFQDDDPINKYRSCAIFRRSASNIEMQVVSEQSRPWLEGVMCARRQRRGFLGSAF